MNFPCNTCGKETRKAKGCIGFILCPDWNAWAREQNILAEEAENDETGDDCCDC